MNHPPSVNLAPTEPVGNRPISEKFISVKENSGDRILPNKRACSCKCKLSVRNVNVLFTQCNTTTFSQSRHCTPASNLGYLAPPRQFFMGAKLFIGTP